MTNEQQVFWEEVRKVQDYAVNVFLAKMSKYHTPKDLLNDVTYETIYEIMELLDGYKSDDLQGYVINKHTGKIINLNTDLHNSCEEWLNNSN